MPHDYEIEPQAVKSAWMEIFETCAAVCAVLFGLVVVMFLLSGCDTSPTVVVLPPGDTNQNTNIGIGVNAPVPTTAPTATPIAAATPAAGRR